MECRRHALEPRSQHVVNARRFTVSALAVIHATLFLTLFLSGCGGSASGIFVILNPSGNQAVDQNQTISFTAFVPNDTTNAGVSWTLSGGRCKAAACGTFANTTTSSVTYQAPKSEPSLLTVTLTATSIAEKRATATLNILVSPAPVISTTTLPGVLNGDNYNQQIVANGGVSPLIFSVSSGTLPPGLHLNTNGVISGRATANGGTFNFSLTVTDQGSPPLTATQAYTIVVAPAPPLSVATGSLPNAAQGSPYNSPLAATGGVPPLTWSISSGSLPPGLALTATTGQISGTPTMQGTFPFTVQVTDSSLLPPNQQPQTATQALSITVGGPNKLGIVTTTLPQADTASLYNQAIRESGGIGPFNWTLTNGILPSGMLLNATTGVISGVATAVSTNTFTVQVTDSESPPASASATFTISVIAATNNNALLSGDYVFVFSGYNANGPVVIGGGMVADGVGNVFGSLDSNNNNPPKSTQNNGPGPTQGNAFTGTYTIGPDGRGTLNITANAVLSSYVFALDGNGNGQFIEVGDTTNLTHGTGILRKQPPPNFVAANFNGNYAFELAGIDSSGKRDAIAGVVQADGVGLFKNGNVDTNDAGSSQTNITGVSGAFLVAQNGRGNASITVPNQGTLNFIFYMITPSDMLFMGFDPLDASHPMTTGEAILQTQGSFDSTALNSPSIAATTGQNSAGHASVSLGLLSPNGTGGISATIDANNAGAITSNASASGSYAVASNGRVSINNLGAQFDGVYLISPNRGFVIGQDTAASSGTLEPQTGGPFTAASFTSYFSLGPPSTGAPDAGSKTASDFAGSIVSDGVSTISGRIGQTTGGNISNLNLALKGTYTAGATGRGTISFGSPTQLPSQFVFYLVSPTQIRAISALSSDTDPSVFFLNH